MRRRYPLPRREINSLLSPPQKPCARSGMEISQRKVMRAPCCGGAKPAQVSMRSSAYALRWCSKPPASAIASARPARGSVACMGCRLRSRTASTRATFRRPPERRRCAISSPREDCPAGAGTARSGGDRAREEHLHELSYGWISNNYGYGAVHNPYDPTRIPGGSSGGTAASTPIAWRRSGWPKTPRARSGCRPLSAASRDSGPRPAGIGRPRLCRSRRASISWVRTLERSRICCCSMPRSPQDLSRHHGRP